MKAILYEHEDVRIDANQRLSANGTTNGKYWRAGFYGPRNGGPGHWRVVKNRNLFTRGELISIGRAIERAEKRQ